MQIIVLLSDDFMERFCCVVDGWTVTMYCFASKSMHTLCSHVMTWLFLLSMAGIFSMSNGSSLLAIAHHHQIFKQIKSFLDSESELLTTSQTGRHIGPAIIDETTTSPNPKVFAKPNTHQPRQRTHDRHRIRDPVRIRIDCGASWHNTKQYVFARSPSFRHVCSH